MKPVRFGAERIYLDIYSASIMFFGSFLTYKVVQMNYFVGQDSS